MAPPVSPFPPSELPDRVQITTKGKGRKGEIDLKKCELLEMVQYECTVDEPRTRDSMVRCWPVERLFRRCKDKKGTFMVETTAWEGASKVV